MLTLNMSQQHSAGRRQQAARTGGKQQQGSSRSSSRDSSSKKQQEAARSNQWQHETASASKRQVLAAGRCRRVQPCGAVWGHMESMSRGAVCFCRTGLFVGVSMKHHKLRLYSTTRNTITSSRHASSTGGPFVRSHPQVFNQPTAQGESAWNQVGTHCGQPRSKKCTPGGNATFQAIGSGIIARN